MKPWILDMWWRDVCFLHWRADAAIVAATLPPGVELDRFEGAAWLSVVPFRMTSIHPRGLPVLPGYAAVPEINLRTYVRVRGVPGVWFYSLDAASGVVVLSARLMTALPYFDAEIVTSERNGAISYASRRRDARAPEGGVFRATYTPAAPVRRTSPGSLDAFLHERYVFFAERRGRLLTAEVRHDAWALQDLDVAIEENSLGATIAHPLGSVPDRATFGRVLRVHATAAGPLASGSREDRFARPRTTG